MPQATDALTTLQQAARSYAANNIAIFPCWWATDGACACGDDDCGSPAKHPIGPAVPQGLNQATADPVKVSAWWHRYPQANIAISLAVNDVFAVDVDGPDGRAHLDQLETEHGGAARRARFRAGRGGRVRRARQRRRRRRR